MSINKRVLKDGSKVYEVREYTGFTLDGKRDRAYVRCSSMAEAKKEQAKLVAQREAMRNRSGRMNFRAYVEGWFLPSKRHLAPSTRDGYARELKLRLLPAFGGYDVRDIDRIAIQAMVDRLCSTRKVATNALALLKEILNECMVDGLIVTNPAKGRFALPPAGPKRHNSTVLGTFEAIAGLFAAVDAYGDETVEKIAVLGALMGLRPEERYGLDCTDINLEEGWIHVHQAYTYASKESGGSVLKDTKTHMDRLVPIPPEARTRLSRLRKPGVVGAFIPGAHSPRIAPASARRKWDRFMAWCQDEGFAVPRVTMENLRHSFATSYLAAGGSVEDLSRILGHEDINTTARKSVV